MVTISAMILAWAGYSVGLPLWAAITVTCLMGIRAIVKLVIGLMEPARPTM